jgi:hypothetical protein
MRVSVYQVPDEERLQAIPIGIESFHPYGFASLPSLPRRN